VPKRYWAGKLCLCEGTFSQVINSSTFAQAQPEAAKILAFLVPELSLHHVCSTYIPYLFKF